MGEINSPLGKTEFKARSRHFTVPDESGDQTVQQPIPAQPAQQPQQTQTKEYSFSSTEAVAPPTPQGSQQYASEKVSWEEAQNRRQRWIESQQQRAANQATPKSRIEMLVGIGRSTIDVPVQDANGTSVFTISTLKTKERKHVSRARDNMFRLKTQESVMEVKTITLAYAISAIDGIPLDSLINSELQRVGEEDRFYMREAFADELDDNVTNLLFENFENMDRENQEKYSVRSEEDVKEVAEAMSKSGSGS